MNHTATSAILALATIAAAGPTAMLAGCSDHRAPVGVIAFQAHVPDADRVGVQTIHADGTDRQVLLPGVPSALQRHPDWSPDGTRMVFTAADDEDTDDLWIADADGSDAHKVVECSTPCLGVDEAAWSPDGSAVVFWRLVQPDDVVTSTLEMLDVATGATTVTTTAPPRTVLLAPRWSPRGDRLVVEWLQLSGTAYDADPTGDVVGVIDLHDPAAGVHGLTDAAQFANNPDWSRAADLIVYAARVGADTTFQDLYVSAPDGSQVRRLTHLADHQDMAVQPTFTPDGRQVLFVRKPNGGSRALLAVVDTDGGEVRPAAGLDEVEGEHPRMRPAS